MAKTLVCCTNVKVMIDFKDIFLESTMMSLSGQQVCYSLVEIKIHYAQMCRS
jgi:hypothetical protein